MSNYDQNQGGLFATDTTGVGEMGGNFKVYPAGQWPAVMIDVQKKESQAGNAFIQCTYQFVECELDGEQYISRINLWHSNPVVVDIAQKEIKALRVALNLSDNDADENHYLNRPVVLDIQVRAKKDANKKPTAEMENNLNKILPYGGQPQAQQAQQRPAYVPPQAQQAPVTGYQGGPRQAYTAPQGQHQGQPAATAKPWATRR